MTKILHLLIIFVALSRVSSIKFELSRCNLELLAQFEPDFAGCVRSSPGEISVTCSNGAQIWQESEEFLMDGLTFTTKTTAVEAAKSKSFLPFLASCIRERSLISIGSEVKMKKAREEKLFGDDLYTTRVNDRNQISYYLAAFSLDDPLPNRSGRRIYIYMLKMTSMTVLVDFHVDFRLARYIKAAFGRFVAADYSIGVEKERQVIEGEKNMPLVTIDLKTKKMALYISFERNRWTEEKSQQQWPMARIWIDYTEVGEKAGDELFPVLQKFPPQKVCEFYLAYFRLMKPQDAVEPRQDYDCAKAKFTSYEGKKSKYAGIVLGEDRIVV